MKNITSREFGGLVFAVILFLSGFVWLVWPQEGVVVRATNDFSGVPGGVAEVVSKKGSRIYGIISMVVGAGVGALAVYRPKS